MKFLMALALRMGRTLAELRQTMTPSELLLWAEYDRTSPVGDVRGDIHNAQLVSAIYGAQGVKVPIDEAVIQWAGDTEEVSQKDPFAGLEAAFFEASR
ncbi:MULTISPECIES: phage tail assembly protein T [Enterobacter cloacae complex]|uniref:phage tail assembly protein T n=2 Tax=Enterobacter TaxID=547 RepID=UPI001E627876|nr:MULTISPECIES: DUF4035 domain-containing protein [Enterobacter cloacae complex]MCK6676066.1 DUF4035 domain-containing protein [Enterobacter asburiae]